MASLNFIVFGSFTAFWFIVGFIAPCFAPKGPNKGIIQYSMALTSVCAWLFWLVTYLMQLNPLIGPKLAEEAVLIIAKEWGNAITD